MKANWNTISEEVREETSKLLHLKNKTHSFVKENKSHLIWASVSTFAMLLVVWWMQMSWDNFTANLLNPQDLQVSTTWTWDVQQNDSPQQLDFSTDIIQWAAQDVNIPDEAVSIDLSTENTVTPVVEQKVDIQSQIDSLFWSEVASTGEVVPESLTKKWVGENNLLSGFLAEDTTKNQTLTDLFWEQTQQNAPHWAAETKIPNQATQELQLENVPEENTFQFKENTHTVNQNDLHWSALFGFWTTGENSAQTTAEDFTNEIQAQNNVDTTQVSNVTPVTTSNSIDDGSVKWILYKNNWRVPYFLLLDSWRKLYLDTKRNLNSEIGQEIIVNYDWNFDSFTLTSIQIPNERILVQSGPWAIAAISLFFAALLAFLLRRKKA